MKWIRFTLDTHTDAVDMLSYMLDEIGAEESCRCLCVNLSNTWLSCSSGQPRIAKVNTKTPTTFFSTYLVQHIT